MTFTTLMTRPTSLALATLALLAATAAQAHQIWIEQPAGQKTAVVRFGEFGENLREASPGPLDKFVRPTATLLSARGEQAVPARKVADGFALPFGAAAGEGIVAEDADYPLYTSKQGDRETQNRYLPAARLVTRLAPQPPRLVLDLVPIDDRGGFRLFFKGEPRPKTKVTLVTQSGWAKEAQTDAQGLVKFDMPWKGTYVAEVAVNDRTAGERPGAGGPEKFEGTSYVTTLTYVKPAGVAPIPAGAAAQPHP
jgi:hypothetical protein